MLEKAARGKRAMTLSLTLHSVIVLDWPSPETGATNLEPVVGATEAGVTTPPKKGPEMCWGVPDQPTPETN